MASVLLKTEVLSQHGYGKRWTLEQRDFWGWHLFWPRAIMTAPESLLQAVEYMTKVRVIIALKRFVAPCLPARPPGRCQDTKKSM
eukprot:5845590-Amphidinium_carterae.2